MPHLSAKFLVAAVTVAALACPVSAATVTFSVEGNASGGPVLGDGNATGVAQSFTMNETLRDVHIGFDLFCLGACEGSVYVINGLPGPGLALSQYEADRAFSSAGGNFTFVFEPIRPAPGGPAFAVWDTLTAGVTYTLVLSLTKGDGFWKSVRNPVPSGGEATLGGAFLIAGRDDFDLGFPPNSIFAPWTEDTPRFVLTGTTDRPPAAIPLPASLPLLSAALGLLAIRRRGT